MCSAAFVYAGLFGSIAKHCTHGPAGLCRSLFVFSLNEVASVVQRGVSLTLSLSLSLSLSRSKIILACERCNDRRAKFAWVCNMILP